MNHEDKIKDLVDKWIEIVGRPESETVTEALNNELIKIIEAEMKQCLVSKFEAYLNCLFWAYQFEDVYEDTREEYIKAAHGLLHIGKEIHSWPEEVIGKGFRAVMGGHFAKLMTSRTKADKAVKWLQKQIEVAYICESGDYFVIKDGSDNIIWTSTYKNPTTKLKRILEDNFYI